MINKRTLTTYEIAGHCQVTPRTVIQWINEGKLKAYRTPGNHSRIEIDEFLGFLKRFNMPIPSEYTSENSTDQKKVLIVDDDKSMVDSIQRFLKREKIYDTEIAYDGFEAGQKFITHKPDLVILDIRMPRVDGYKLCSAIRNDPANKNVKILIISGLIEQKDRNAIIKLGANDYLGKPFTTAELKMKLQNLFGWNRRVKDGAKGKLNEE